MLLQLFWAKKRMNQQKEGKKQPTRRELRRERKGDKLRERRIRRQERGEKEGLGP